MLSKRKASALIALAVLVVMAASPLSRISTRSASSFAPPISLARRRRSRRGAPARSRAILRSRVPTRGGDIPARFFRPGTADPTHARADSRRASRRHQRIPPGRPRGGSRGDGIRRADGRRSRPAALQDHAAGHRHYRGRGALDQRAAAVPHRREDRRSSASAFPAASRSSPPAASRFAIAWRS